ncbi:MAG: hypothetical protein WC708_17775 [Lentisphaeria bacterium]
MKKILSCALVLAGTLLPLGAAPTLTGVTAHPDSNMFKKGEPVMVTFQASGLAPGEKSTLELDVVDQNDDSIKKLSVPVAADASGNWQGSVQAPNEKYGFYRLRAKLSNGVALPKIGSRPAGCLTYAVLYDPAERKLYSQDESFFGIHGNTQGAADLMPWIGARWCGYPFSYDDGGYQALLERRKATGNPDWVFYQCSWIIPGTGGHPMCFWAPEQLQKHSTFGTEKRLQSDVLFTDPEGERLYREGWKKIAAFGKTHLYHNANALYQVLWEPDLGRSNEDILKMYKAAYQAIHEADLRARVLGYTASNITAPSVEQHRKLFEMGFLNYIDELSIHPYIGYPVELNGLVENVRTLKRHLKQYANGRDIRIRGTESGYSATATREQELLQMRGQVRAALILLGEGFASNEPFYGSDHFQHCLGDYGITYNLCLPQEPFGAKTVSPRPTVPALSAASFFLEGHRPTGVIEYLGDSVLGYSYADRDDHCVIALWDFSGKPAAVELPVGRDELRVADLMGNCRTVKTENGTVKLTVTEDPIYLLDVNPKLYGRQAKKAIVPDTGSLTGIAGDTVVVKGKVQAFASPLAGVLELVPPARMKLAAQTVNLSLKPGQAESFAIPVALGETLADGKYPLSLRLRENGRVLTAAGVLLDVKPPVEVRAACPSFVSGEPGMEFTVANLTGTVHSGTLETRIPGYPEARQRVPFTLNGHEEKILRADFRGLSLSPFLPVKVAAAVTLQSGYRFSTQNEANFLAATYLPGIGVKGEFSGWNAPVRHPMDSLNPVRSRQFHAGANDLNASIAFGWNEAYLLLDVEVIDDVYCQPFSGERIWNGDSLQFAFAKRQTAKEAANDYGKQLELAYSEINFALTANGMEANRTYTFDPAICPPGDISPGDCPRQFTKTVIPGGKVKLHYQIAVPWRFLHLAKVSAGMAVCFAATVNDRDDPAQSDVSAIGIFDRVQAPPRFFGTIVLER